MPDTIRLSVLPRLREEANFSLAHVAHRCGLTGSNGRRSVAAWEAGESKPRSRYRRPFALYLLRDLNLVQTPEQFDAVWVILIEEWDWFPLDPDERADLWRKALQETDPWAEVEAIVDGVGTDDETTTDRGSTEEDPTPPPIIEAATARATESERTEAEADAAGPMVRYAVVAAFFVTALGIFGLNPQANFPWNDWAFPSVEEMPTPTPTPVTMRNYDFEAGDLSEWEIVGEVDCTADLVADPSLAQNGNYFLALTRADAECVSIRRDLVNKLNIGDTMRYAVWTRATDPRPQLVELVIWGGSYSEAEGETVHIKGSKHVLIDDSGWQCIETTLTLDTYAYDFFRGELYLHNEVGQTIEIDSAMMQDGRTPLCPPAAPRLIGGEFEHKDHALAWHGTGDGCNLLIDDEPAGAKQGNAYLHIDSTGPDCPSIYQDWLQPTQAETNYTTQIWVRSADGLPRRGALALRALGAQDVHTTSPFVVAGEWQCIDATLRMDGSSTYSGLRTEIYFDDKANGGSYLLDSAKLVAGAGVCPTDEITLPDSGFETQAAAIAQGQSLPVPIWGAINGCEVNIVQDESLARSGLGLLTAREAPGTDCGSIYADIVTQAPAPMPIRIAFWGRAAGNRPLQGTLSLWAADGTGRVENSTQVFRLNNSGWRCIETFHTVSEPDFAPTRMEIYLETPDEDGYLFDDIQFGTGDTPLCPEMDLGLRSTELTHPDRTSYPGGTVSVEVEVRNQGNVSLEACGALVIWIADSPGGPPIEMTFVRRVNLPALTVNQSSPRIVTDVSIPLGLSPQQDHYVVWQIEGDGCTDVNPNNDQESRKIALSACETAGIYCDVPVNHWARAEVERWHDIGISTGCRSNTTPFVDRPFCPGEQVRRITFAIFALRHLLGGGYVPERGYEGRFADLPEDVSHRWALWVEEFYERGYSLNDAACPPSADKPNFCPDAAISRADLVLSLAGKLDWALSPVEGTIYRDVTEDTPANRAIEYAARNGLLSDADPYCPSDGIGARFCPDDPARRAFTAIVMVRAFGEEGLGTGD
ncbi:hypothetical protein GC175_13050 [bacterium]|nr:hypothetical protein [bacterium]